MVIASQSFFAFFKSFKVIIGPSTLAYHLQFCTHNQHLQQLAMLLSRIKARVAR